MSLKTLILKLAGTVFGIVMVFHVLRIATEVPVTIGEWFMPLWLNYFGTAGAAFLCIALWRLSMDRKESP